MTAFTGGHDMIAWIMSNAGTILVSLLLLGGVFSIVQIMIKDKKQGKSTCGGNCANCKMCSGCCQANDTNSKWKEKRRKNI